MTLTHQIEKIGPAEAEKLLETNTKNRRLAAITVTKLAKDMTEGRWMFDGSPIRIDDKGDLVDGQHRLWAILESETTQDFLVVRGVEEEAMATMDTGKSRTFADILTLHDHSIPNVNNVAAVTAIYYKWAEGRRGTYLRAGGQGNQVPYPVLLKFFDENREAILEGVRQSSTFVKKSGVTVSAGALAYWVFSTLDKEDADFFIGRIKDGLDLSEGSPILALRKWMQSSYFLTPRPQTEVQIAYLIKAWNAYREGNDIQVLVWKRGGANPEAFPTPR